MYKIIKVFNTLSVLLFMAVLLTIYAYLPIQVDTGITALGHIHKQTFFYSVLIFFGAINLILRIGLFIRIKRETSQVAAWGSAILFIVNFYICTLVGFVGVFNNANSIDPASYAYLNYLGPLFFLIWLVVLIFFWLRKK